MIKLDLMELSDRFEPEKKVKEIFRQNPTLTLPIPINEIAKASGIIKIENLEAKELEGMLVSNLEKSCGVIFYKKDSILGRQRFTIGHELGHFLLPLHDANQKCSSYDIQLSKNNAKLIQFENEANLFSQLILLPDHLISKEINRVIPTIESLKKIETISEMSFEAVSNKCAALSNLPFALIYSKDGIVRYCWRNKYNFKFYIPLKKGDPMPLASKVISLDLDEESITTPSESSPSNWFKLNKWQNNPCLLIEQVYTQSDGYQVTMLSY